MAAVEVVRCGRWRRSRRRGMGVVQSAGAERPDLLVDPGAGSEGLGLADPSIRVRRLVNAAAAFEDDGQEGARAQIGVPRRGLGQSTRLPGVRSSPARRPNRLTDQIHDVTCAECLAQLRRGPGIGHQWTPLRSVLGRARRRSRRWLSHVRSPADSLQVSKPTSPRDAHVGC